jgi:hypothetical protein|tara:strand:+ start:1833 stop:1994 length:162 start_codon:yes stop_codon:yes gene_type:complete
VPQDKFYEYLADVSDPAKVEAQGLTLPQDFNKKFLLQDGKIKFTYIQVRTVVA